MSDSPDSEMGKTVPAPSSGRGAGESTGLESLHVEGEARYLDLNLLGKGGMGEVRLVRDRRLEREVALKRIREVIDDPEITKRFVREVRVQGQLDHPAVVPVYELGLTPEGHPWFTMKRVRGQSLHDVLKRLEKGEPAAVARFSRWRLLSIFNTVCQCIDSAHASGVLHRDLKPANVMVGDFDEVYVIDWGLARIKGLAEGETTPSGRSVVSNDGLGQTGLGLAVGTQGYMAPEQACGRTDLLDERTDVFALGVILHDLLFLSSPHDFSTPRGRPLRGRHGGVPSSEVAPELDAIWRKACQPNQSDRFPGARALAEAVERFLEGERDEERRRELSDEQLRLAQLALTQTHEGRGQALQALGRALALDPSNAAALRQLSLILATPPAQTPPEAQRQLAVLGRARARQTLNAAAMRLGIWSVSIAGALAALGMKSVPLGVCLLLLHVVSALITALLARRSDAEHLQLPAGLLGALCLGALAVSFNPLVVVPTLAATQSMLFATNAPAAHRKWMVLVSCLAVLLPAVGMNGLIELRDGMLLISSPLLPLEGAALPVLLLLSLLPIATPSLLVGRLRDAFVDVQRVAVVQAAALKQLIPEGREQG